jgi:hypothetical protein
MLRLRTEGIIAAAGTGGPPDVDRPETYNDFVGVGSSTDYSTIAAALAAGEKLIFLRAGTHNINNPIVINTTEPLYIHGFADERTIIKAQNLNQPLFIVQNCPLLNVQRVGLDCAGAFKNPGNTDQIAFDFQNSSPTRVEFAQLGFRGVVVVNIEGPGDYILQNVNFSSHNMVQASVVVDHPGASFWYVNGHTFGDAFAEHLLETNEIYHIWQKRGHVEIYNLLTVAARGDGADFRFDTRSPKGVHVICGVRSEGVRNIHYPGGSAHADGIFSHLAYVPPTSEQVDILFLANEVAAAHDLQDPNPGLAFVPNMFRYNGAGTVWAFNNICRQADHLFGGNAPNATIIAAGNCIMRDDTLDGILGTAVVAGNLEHRFTLDQHNGNPLSDPRIDHIEVALLNSFGTLPEPPVRDEIPSVATPRVETLHPFMELRNVKTQYGAVGNGSTDDTNALQNAINDAGDRLFFPAGTYRITGRLAHHFSPDTTAFHGFVGGWWAGAGQSTTKIQRTNAGGVFITGGMSRYQIQDMSFEASGNSQDCVHMVRQTNFSGGNVQSSRCTLYRCSCINGSACLGWANDFNVVGSNQNTESMLALECTLQGGARGLDNGDFNAFGNTLLNCTINNCTFGFRSRNAPCSLLQCTLTGCDSDNQELSFTRSHYFARCTSNSPLLWEQVGSFTTDWYLPVWDNCTWTGLNSGQVVVELDYGCGPAFLHCSMPTGRILLTDDFTTMRKVALKLWSTIGEWDASKNQPNQTSAMYHSTD